MHPIPLEIRLMRRMRKGRCWTYKRNISHVEDDDTLMFGCVFRYSTQMRFQDVITVQEW